MHDSVEDMAPELRPWLRNEIERTLDAKVLALVDDLTDDSPVHWPSIERKERHMARIAKAPWAVKVIELADLTASMMEGPAPEWTPLYAAGYLHQRTKIVNQVLQSSSAVLAGRYHNAMGQPVWQSALKQVLSNGACSVDSIGLPPF